MNILERIASCAQLEVVILVEEWICPKTSHEEVIEERKGSLLCLSHRNEKLVITRVLRSKKMDVIERNQEFRVRGSSHTCCIIRSSIISEGLRSILA